VDSRHWTIGFCSVAWLLASEPLFANELHGYATLASDYVFRGVSQSNEDPTLQAGLEYQHQDGVFVGLFAARTDYPDSRFGTNQGNMEIDAYLGFSRAAGRHWSWDVAVQHYDFPDSSGFDYSYNELAANLHFRDILRLGTTVSNDAAANGAGGWTAEIGLRHPLGKWFQASGTLGHYDFKQVGWDDYRYWDLGISAVAGAFTFDARYFDTSDGAESFASPRLTRGRVVLSVSAGF
jgi:uncharacterized protein (TIGR02001 family)